MNVFNLKNTTCLVCGGALAVGSLGNTHDQCKPRQELCQVYVGLNHDHTPEGPYPIGPTRGVQIALGTSTSSSTMYVANFTPTTWVKGPTTSS